MSDCNKFKDNDRVRIVHQRDRVGTIVGAPRRQAGECWYKVEFPDGRVQNVPERSLEIYEGAQDVETLLRNAESALKDAKASGERYLFYTQQMSGRVAQRLTLENKLRQALEREEFVLHYQPKVDIDSGEIAGVEALIRWESADMGLVPPAQFIPLMEETGLILEVGAWALKRAVVDHRRWGEQGIVPPRVAVNVSPIRDRSATAAIRLCIVRSTFRAAFSFAVQFLAISSRSPSEYGAACFAINALISRCVTVSAYLRLGAVECV